MSVVDVAFFSRGTISFSEISEPMIFSSFGISS